MRSLRKSVARSFAHAIEGVLFCLRTQRHMQVHCAIITFVLIAAIALRVSSAEMLHLMLAMALVLVAEMINTAIESAIDLIVTIYNPHAKIAKDVAAGAVLIAAFYSVIVAVIIFVTNERLIAAILRLPQFPGRPQLGLVQIVALGLILLAIVIGVIKRRHGHGTFLKGGIVSGHSAIGFFLGTCIFLFTRDAGITALAAALAILIAQSRIQSNIHSFREVLSGGVLGAVVAVLLYWPSA